MKEQINENYSLQDNFNNNSKQTPVPLIQLLDNFTKPGNFYLLENRVNGYPFRKKVLLSVKN